MIYYTADLHIGHENVIRFCNRPFSMVEEMNRTLVEYWNAVVTDKDDVYICGDMFYRSKEDPGVYLRQMKGHKHLIRGNHDKWVKAETNRSYFDSIQDYLEINDDGNRVILFHYPILEWNACHRDSYHVYGHIHNSRSRSFLTMRSIERALNAGVDINHFMPVTLQQLIINNAALE